MNKLTTENIERLRELLTEMKERVQEARDIIHKGPVLQWERAKSYCLAHIEMALDNDHGYIGSDTTLAEVIDELEDSVNSTPCKKCGSPLDGDGLCTDEACPYSDHEQDEDMSEQQRRDEKHGVYGGQVDPAN
jgi:hypothetical protein